MTPGMRQNKRQLSLLLFPAVVGLHGCSDEIEMPAASALRPELTEEAAQAIESSETVVAGMGPRTSAALYDPVTGLPCHLVSAQELVDNVADAPFVFDDPDINRWGTPGTIDWANFTATTQGASLFTLSLLHCDTALTPSILRGWWGSSSPTPVRYYEQILAGNRFRQISNIGDVRPGDVLAINYTDRSGSGHLVIIEGSPVELATPIRPLVPDTTQYALPIIDSTSTAHGCATDTPTADTRWVPTDPRRPCAGGSTDGGAGRGTLRLYATSRDLPDAGAITGHSWSLATGATYHPQSGVRPHVIGRLVGSDPGDTGGGCAAPLVECDGACVDTSSAPDHCESCGRSCLGSACSDSMCEPVVLASDQDVNEHIDVDATSVYWTTRTWPSYLGDVMKVDKAGEELTVLASPQPSPYPILVDGPNVYWGNTESGTQQLLRVSASGGAISLFAGGQATPTDIAKDATSLYWTNYANGTIMGASKAGGAPVALVVGQDYPRTLAVDDMSIYWINTGTVGVTDSAVMKASKAGGAPTTLASGEILWYALAVDDTSLYFAQISTDGIRRIMKADKVSGAPVVLAVAGDGNPNGIAVDATSVYWTDYNYGRVMKVAKSGGAPVILADANHPNAIAVDDTHVYWGDSGDRTIVKVAK
jgi:hypothetical protein